MHPLVSGLVHGLEKNHGYALALVAGIDDEQLVAQPFGDGRKPMNHAAWVLSHLGVYRPIIAALVRGEVFPDPHDHVYGMKSVPLPDRSAYGSLEEMRQRLEAGKLAVVAALESATDEAWSAPVTLARWQPRWSSVGMAVSFLLLCHENMHLGQLSAWRRAMGMAAVTM
jgi:uncharacterized damage-inducible protein DinB